MGTMVVVAVQPIGRHVTHFLHAVEDVAVEHLGAVGLVESFDKGVLCGLAANAEVKLKKHGLVSTDPAAA